MTTKHEAMKRIEKRAEALEAHGLSRAKAIDTVMQLEPHLYTEHKNADPDPAPVAKQETPDFRPGTVKAVAWEAIKRLARQEQRADETVAKARTRVMFEHPEGIRLSRQYSGLDADLTPAERIAKAEKKASRDFERGLVFKGVSRPRIDSAVQKFRRDLARKRGTEPIRKRAVDVVAKRARASSPAPKQDWYTKLRDTVGIDRTIALLTNGDGETPAPTKGTRGPVSFDQALSKLRGE